MRALTEAWGLDVGDLKDLKDVLLALYAQDINSVKYDYLNGRD